MNQEKTVWSWGDKSRVARGAGIGAAFLSDIMAGRKPCSAVLAVKLERSAKDLGYDIPRTLWAFEDMRQGNPLFKGRAA